MLFYIFILTEQYQWISIYEVFVHFLVPPEQHQWEHTKCYLFIYAHHSQKGERHFDTLMELKRRHILRWVNNFKLWKQKHPKNWLGWITTSTITEQQQQQQEKLLPWWLNFYEESCTHFSLLRRPFALWASNFELSIWWGIFYAYAFCYTHKHKQRLETNRIDYIMAMPITKQSILKVLHTFECDMPIWYLHWCSSCNYTFTNEYAKKREQCSTRIIRNCLGLTKRG